MVELEPLTAFVALLACVSWLLYTIGDTLSDLHRTPIKSAALAFVCLGWFLVAVDVGTAFFKAVFP